MLLLQIFTTEITEYTERREWKTGKPEEKTFPVSDNYSPFSPLCDLCGETS
jgi:hypothetical protein